MKTNSGLTLAAMAVCLNLAGTAMAQVKEKVETSDRLVGESVPQFFITPNTPATLVFKVADASTAAKYSLHDYWGRPVSSGEATTAGNGKLSVSLTLPPGFYEMRFADAGQTFGVVSQPAFQGKPDVFFGIDAALSWLDKDQAARIGMISILKRSGVAFARERMGWANVNPKRGQYDFDTARNFDFVRQEYARQGIPVLDMADAPPVHFRSKHTPGTSRYGDELAAMAESWQTIAKHYLPSWGSVEVSNEPELTPWPADQYVPMAKMLAYAQDKAGIKVPIGGGVFGGMPPGAFHDVCSASGMLDVVDYVSLHTYNTPGTLGILVGQYRDWMKTVGKTAMPLWLTEAGKPWTIGPPRAPQSEDTDVAAATVGLVVEARANGLARVCPFVLPYYEEGGLKSFSMMGKDRSPMRAMAGYVNSIRLLTDQPYVGDIENVAGADAVRVFGDGDEQLIVLRTKDLDENATVKLGLAVTRVEGIDGRPLKIGADGSVPVPDGVGYAWASKSSVARVLKTDTPTRKLYAIGQQTPPKRGAAPAVVLQHPLAAEKGKMSPRRYLLDPATAKALPLKIRLDNMGDTPQSVTLTPKLPGKKTSTVIPAQTVTVPPKAHQFAEWTIDASGALDVAELRMITVTGRTKTGGHVAPIAIPYQVEGELAEHLARNAYQIKLPITDMSQWSKNIVGHGTMQMTTTGDVFRFDATYTKPGERWAYPRVAIKEPVDPKRATGVLLRARIVKPGRNVAVMVFQNNKPGFWALEVMPADGEWHVCYVPFSDLQAMPGNPDMQNSVPNPARFTGIQVGMASNSQDNAMEVSHLMIVGPK